MSRHPPLFPMKTRQWTTRPWKHGRSSGVRDYRHMRRNSAAPTRTREPRGRGCQSRFAAATVTARAFVHTFSEIAGAFAPGLQPVSLQLGTGWLLYCPASPRSAQESLRHGPRSGASDSPYPEGNSSSALISLIVTSRHRSKMIWIPSAGRSSQ